MLGKFKFILFNFGMELIRRAETFVRDEFRFTCFHFETVLDTYGCQEISIIFNRGRKKGKKKEKKEEEK